jgi:hypothetical protein
MAAWPRRITRGLLKGQVFESESAYRKAYAERKGITRYQQRQAKARALGYSGYPERRKTLKRLGGDKEAERLLLREPDKAVRKMMIEELARYKEDDRDRTKRFMEEANSMGVSVTRLFERFYKLVDLKGLRGASIR